MKLNENMNKKYTQIAVYVVVTAAIICLMGLLVYHAPEILAGTMKTLSWVLKVAKPIVLGFVFCYLVEPVVTFIEERLKKLKIFKKKQSACRTIAVFSTLFFVIILFAFIISLLIFSFTDQLRLANFDDIIVLCNTYIKNINDFYLTVQDKLAELNGQSVELNNYLKDAATYLLNILRNFANSAVMSVSNISSFLTTFFFGLIIAIYFLIDGRMIQNYLRKVSKALLSRRINEKIHSLLADADQVFSGYIRGQLMDAMVMMILISVALAIIGVRFSVLIGVLAGIGNLIPYCGPFVAYAGTIVVCLINGDFKQLVLGLIVLFIVQTLDGNIIGPRLLSKSIEIHPLLVIISLIFGSAVGGLGGMLLAVPIGAFLKVLFMKFIDYRLEIREAKENPSCKEE